MNAVVIVRGHASPARKCCRGNQMNACHGLHDVVYELKVYLTYEGKLKKVMTQSQNSSDHISWILSLRE